jgi:glycosyltransferase involved in cell wall biosynthesis
MKILNLVGYTWSTGGPAKIVYDHATVQLDLRHEVHVLTTFSDGDQLYPSPLGMKVFKVQRHWFSKFFPEFSLEAISWIKKNAKNYDVIHIHGPFHFLGLIPFILNIKTPKVITIHGILDKWVIKKSYFLKKLISLLIQKRAFKKAALIQINNEGEKDDLIQFFNYQHPNVKVIPNGMILSDYEKIAEKGKFRLKYGIEAETKILLFLARLNLKKGLDLLLPAFKKYQIEYPNTILVLAGPDDGYLQQTKLFIDSNNLNKNILLTGMLTGDEKKEVLSDADAFILSSYSEGFSIAVLEAMISGCPTILSRYVGFIDSIVDYNASEIIELNVDSIESGIHKVFLNDEYAKTIAINSKKLVSENYDIKIVAQKLLDEFSKILHKN